MLKLTLVLSISILAFTLVASNSDSIPQKVLIPFNQTFPKAIKTQWKKMTINYTATFTSETQKYKTTWDSIGNLLITEINISNKDLPKPVIQYLTMQQTNGKIIKSWKVQTPQNKEYYYCLLKEDGVKSKLTISKDGYLLAY